MDITQAQKEIGLCRSCMAHSTEGEQGQFRVCDNDDANNHPDIENLGESTFCPFWMSGLTYCLKHKIIEPTNPGCGLCWDEWAKEHPAADIKTAKADEPMDEGESFIANGCM